jgi:hypothetical protein
VTVNSNGTLHYTPEANSNGTDAVTYNGSFTSTAHVTVTLTSVNDALVANADAYSAAKNGKLTVTGSGVLANDTERCSSMPTAPSPTRRTVTTPASTASPTGIPTAYCRPLPT